MLIVWIILDRKFVDHRNVDRFDFIDRVLIDRDAAIFQWLRDARVTRRSLHNVQLNAAIRPGLLDGGSINVVGVGLVGNTAIGKLHGRLLLQGCWDVGVKK
jgi:hypothetical protein